MSTRIRRIGLCAGVAGIGVALLISGGRRASAEGEWTLLPEGQWHSEFSPRYTNATGSVFCEGDPLVNRSAPVTFDTRTYTPPEGADPVPVTYIRNQARIDFREGVSAASIRTTLQSFGVRILSAWYAPRDAQPLEDFRWFHVEILPGSPWRNQTAAFIAMLESRPDVRSAGFNDLLDICGFPQDAPPNDAYYGAGLQQTIDLLNCRDAWKVECGAINPTGVVIVDTGVDMTHPDLINKIYRMPGNSIGGTQGIAVMPGLAVYGDPTTDPDLSSLQTDVIRAPSEPIYAHGTMVASVAAAETNNVEGMAGCGAGTQWMSARLHMYSQLQGGVKLFAGYAVADLITTTRILEWYYTSANGFGNLRGVNQSLTFPVYDRQLLRALRKDMKSNDRLYVAAAGNAGSGTPAYPAAFPGVLGVTGAVHQQSTHPFGQYMSWDTGHAGSNWNGPGLNPSLTSAMTLDLSAYGVASYYEWQTLADVQGPLGYNTGTGTSGNYASNQSGTSLASPSIAALAALLFSRDGPTTTAASDVVHHIVKWKKGGRYTQLQYTVGSEMRQMPDVADFKKCLEKPFR